MPDPVIDAAQALLDALFRYWPTIEATQVGSEYRALRAALTTATPTRCDQETGGSGHCTLPTGHERELSATAGHRWCFCDDVPCSTLDSTGADDA